MKAKTIKAELRKRVDAWLETIEDEAVRELVKKNMIVTGGSIASMLLSEPVNDYDVYFRNRDTTLAVAKYYVERFKPKSQHGIACSIHVDEKDDEGRLPHPEGRIRVIIKSAGIASEEGTSKAYQYFESRPEGEANEYVDSVMRDPGEIHDKLEETEAAVLNDPDFGKPKYRPVFLSSNAITLSQKLQIVLRFFGEPDEIHKNYDFVHCTNYWTSWDDELVLRQPALESLLSRELRYVGSKYPVCSIIRLRKFIKRNWTISAGQILKMVLQCGELDLKDRVVLQDQLTGVDAAYFAQLMNAISDTDPQKINSAYLIEIIDRMF